MSNTTRNRNSGYSNSGNRNSGFNNSGNRNSGNWNSGNWNSGNRNSGYSNSGNRNSGFNNSGNRNSGNWNSGNDNSKYSNSGNRNSGNRNSGNGNSGNGNSGDWNMVSYESGSFNTVQSKTIRVFDADCDREEWENAEKPDCLYFELTEWIENEDLPCGGELKTYSYKEAFTASMEKATPEEIKQIKALPNFNAQKFFEISGFMIKDTVTITVQGKDIEISTQELESIKRQLK